MIERFRGRYFFLSNFYPLHRITSEHVFQAMKTTIVSEQVWVLMAPTAAEAKNRGRQVTLRPGWDEMRVDVMEVVQLEKFRDHLELKTQLLATVNQELQEGNNWGDTFWGRIPASQSWRGQNHLGKILMKIRKNLR